MKKLLVLLLLPLLFACSKDDDKAGGTIDHNKQATEYQNLLIGGNWIRYDQWGTPTSFYVFSEDKSSLKGNNLFQKYEVVSADNKTARGRSSGNYYISWSGSGYTIYFSDNGFGSFKAIDENTTSLGKRDYTQWTILK